MFPATRKSSVETTPSTRAARGGEGSEWCGVPPDHAQQREETYGSEHVGQHVQALDKPRHHTAKTVCVRRSRGETDAFANRDAGEPVQLNSSRQQTG